MSRSISSPISSSSVESRSGMTRCSSSMSEAIIACLRLRIRPRRKWSNARRGALTISQAPGFSGTPVTGHRSRAASSASCVKSSASGTSRSILAKLVISRGCSIRQTARIARWVSAAVMAADRVRRPFPSRTTRGKRAKLADPFPTRHEILVELHELLRRGQGLFFARQLEDRIAADDFLGLHEWAVGDAELAARYAHLRACGHGHEPAMVKQAAGLDFPIGELVHRLEEFRCRRPGVGGFDYEHETHLRTPQEGEPRAPSPLNCLAN